LGGLDIEDAQYVSKDESHFRSGINRLYYSVFQNIMLSFPEFKVKEQEKQVIHQKMLVFLNDIKQFNIARKFARMRELRVQADYFSNTKIQKKDFLEMLEDHDAVIEILEEFKPH